MEVFIVEKFDVRDYMDITIDKVFYKKESAEAYIAEEERKQSSIIDEAVEDDEYDGFYIGEYRWVIYKRKIEELSE